MNEYIEILGEWWLPHNSEIKINGVLKYEPNKDIELTLIGCFGEFEDVFTMEDKRFESIHGFTTNGKKITLIDCSRSDYKISMPGMITEKYCSSSMMIGDYFDNEGSIKLKRISFSFDNLEQWLSLPSYKIEHDDKGKNFNIEYSLPESINAEYKGAKVSIEYTSITNGNLFKKFSIEQTGWISFISEDYYLSISDLFHFIESFSNLLTLCSAVYIEPIKIKSKSVQGNDLEFIFRKLNTIETKRLLSRHDFIFNFHDIKHEFQKFLNIWIDKYEALEPIIHYFVDAHKKDVFSPVSFVKLVQTLESFSRRMRHNWIEDQSTLDTKIEEVLSCINNEENKEWLKGIFKYVNEPTLSTRLRGLFRETNFLLNLSSTKISSLVYKIVETRNYYTHFDERKKDKVLDIHGMFYLGQLFKLMLRSLILKELGFNDEFILNNIDKKRNRDSIKEGLKL